MKKYNPKESRVTTLILNQETLEEGILLRIKETLQNNKEVNSP